MTGRSRRRSRPSPQLESGRRLCALKLSSTENGLRYSFGAHSYLALAGDELDPCAALGDVAVGSGYEAHRPVVLGVAIDGRLDGAA